MKNFCTLFILLILSISASVAQTTPIPDVNFEQALIDLGYDTGPIDGSVPTANISGVQFLTISNKGISDLTGISDFIALRRLWCSRNSLTALDLSNNLALEYLSCYSNNLSTLDVSSNIALEALYCYNNNLTSLNVNGNVNLLNLSCSHNPITSLDVSTNTALVSLKCDNILLSSLDVSNNLALEELFCYENNLSALDVSSNLELTALECHTNSLGSLDVTNNVKLTWIFGQRNNLTSLDVSKNVNLTWLDFSYNNISSIDVSKNVSLFRLYCTDNDLNELDISSNQALAYIGCRSNNLTCLDIRNGNNANLSLVAISNFSLSNILVDDPDNIPSTGWLVDANTEFVAGSAPLAICNSGLSIIIDEQNPNISVSVLDVGSNSTTDCGGIPLLSFDAAGEVTSLTYACTDEAGVKTIDVYASLGNGLQSSCSTTINLEVEIHAIPILQVLYTTTNGDTWTNNSGWLSNCDPCDKANNGANPWYGITCDANNENVLKILLDQNNLQGSIPAELGSLNGLTELTLFGNNLSGCYPQQLIGLCAKSGLSLTDAMISDGNIGLTSWEDFCNNQSNACCPSILELDWEPVCDGTYKSSGDILVSSDLNGNAAITLSVGAGNTVTIPSGSQTTISSAVVITENGCN